MVIITKYIERRKRERLNKTAIATFEKLISSLDEEIVGFETSIDLMQKEYKVDIVPPVINNFLFFRIAFRDIFTTIKLLITVEGEQGENLNIRVLAHQLFEFLKKTKVLLGRQMIESLAGFPDEEYLIMELFKLQKYQKAITRLLFDDLGKIRNNTIGHLDLDSVTVNRIIKEINPKTVVANFVVVWMLFALTLNFHKNIFDSIIALQNKEALGTIEIHDNSIDNTTKRKRRGVDEEFKRILFILEGVEPEIAEILCDLSKDDIDKLKKTVEGVIGYLNKKK